MWPRRRAVPGGTSSLPVVITATRGGRTTSTLRWPPDAIPDSTVGVRRLPRAATRSPALRSSPACRTCMPGRGVTSTVTVGGSGASGSVRSVSSRRTTVSASPGSVAPVMIRTASPGPMRGSAVEPAGTSATTVSVTGPPPARSAWRSA